jgi:hypothetical protein
MALITVTDYTDRYGSGGGDTTQIKAMIDDVSAEIVDYALMLDADSGADDWGVGETDTAPPAAIAAACARIVNRAIGNPFGISQEGLGDHQRTFTVGASGGMMSPKDRRIVRRAAGLSGAKALEMEGYLPLPTEVTDSYTLGDESS